MSWNAPQNWTEALDSISHGFNFTSTRLGVTAESLHVLSDARRDLPAAAASTKAGKAIIDSSDRVTAAYMTGSDRTHAYEPDDVVYYIRRGNQILGYITHDHQVTICEDPTINPTARHNHARATLALGELAARRAEGYQQD